MFSQKEGNYLRQIYMFQIPKLPIFYIVISGVAAVVFLCAFTLVILQYSSRDKTFPPVLTSCPDYWKLNLDQTCEIPIDGKNTGNMRGHQIYEYSFGDIKQYSLMSSMYDPVSKRMYTGTPYNARKGYYADSIPYGYDNKNPQKGRIDFFDLGWASTGSSVCEKRKWARSHNIAWDGITNYSHCDA